MKIRATGDKRCDETTLARRPVWLMEMLTEIFDAIESSSGYYSWDAWQDDDDGECWRAIIFPSVMEVAGSDEIRPAHFHVSVDLVMDAIGHDGLSVEVSPVGIRFFADERRRHPVIVFLDVHSEEDAEPIGVVDDTTGKVTLFEDDPEPKKTAVAPRAKLHSVN